MTCDFAGVFEGDLEKKTEIATLSSHERHSNRVVAGRTVVVSPVAKMRDGAPRFSSSANIGRPKRRHVVHRQGVT